MKTDEQRIAIAEFCGAKWRRQVTTGCVWLMLNEPTESLFQVIERPDPIPGYAINDTPDYPNDLNAVHEAEKNLSDTQTNDQWSRYCEELNALCCRIPCGGGNRLCGYTIHASATQRAEALLRTIGKWKD